MFCCARARCPLAWPSLAQLGVSVQLRQDFLLTLAATVHHRAHTGRQALQSSPHLQINGIHHVFRNWTLHLPATFPKWSHQKRATKWQTHSLCASLCCLFFKIFHSALCLIGTVYLNWSETCDLMPLMDTTPTFQICAAHFFSISHNLET